MSLALYCSVAITYVKYTYTHTLLAPYCSTYIHFAPHCSAAMTYMMYIYTHTVFGIALRQ